VNRCCKISATKILPFEGMPGDNFVIFKLICWL
jgi:hypothetical protein